MGGSWVWLGWWLVWGWLLAGEQGVSAEELVRQLGDPNYQVREIASQKLIRLGHKALPALEAGMKDADPEIRRRCQQIYPQALIYAREERIKAFLAASEGKEGEQLPCWGIFRELVGGGDAAAKRFFADIVRQDPLILDKAARAVRGNDDRLRQQVQQELAGLCEGLVQQAYNSRVGPGVVLPEQLGLALLLSALPYNRGVMTSQIRQIYGLCSHMSVRHILTQKDDKAKVLRRLVVGAASDTTDVAVLQQLFQLGVSLDFPELAPLARRVAANKEVAAYVRGQALSVAARCGGKQDLAFIEGFLSDQSLICVNRFGRQNQQFTIKTEIRDVALALLIDLTGQRMEEYGFPTLKIIFPDGHPHSQQFRPTVQYVPHYYGFIDEEERAAALKKWQQWRREHPQP